MPRRKKPDAASIIPRLLKVKVMIAGMKDAMPTAARDLRREAGEALDDLIGDLR